MSATLLPTPSRDVREIPGAIAKREADAAFAWSSQRRLQVTKGEGGADLSADDLRRLLRFVSENSIEAQL